MKLIFPSKKFQIKLVLLGAIFGIIISIILWLSADSVCSFNPGSICLTALYASSLFWFVAYFPFGFVNEWLFGSNRAGAILGFIAPIVFYGLVFWFVGSILWIVFTAIKKKENAD